MKNIPSTQFTRSVLFTLSFLIGADAHSAFVPPNFIDQGRQVVFADFQSAQYRIELDRSDRVARVETSIEFEQSDIGGTVFDLVAEPDEVFIDDLRVRQRSVTSPDGKAQFRIIDEDIAPGKHRLTIRNSIPEGVRFPFLGGVNTFFSIRDLADRMFLEQYIPTTLEYDQYKATMNVNIGVRNPNRHVILANGKVTTAVSKSGKGQYIIEYPEYFTASSFFFHVFPKRTYAMKKFVYKTGSGREIPITLYGSKWRLMFQAKKFKKTTLDVLAELERDYGEFPHPQIFIYAKGSSGGMEHSGATETSLPALDHELFHSYYAKGVMPANGSAGFLDEAMASWRDYGYFKADRVSFDLSNVGNHGPYTRKTDRRAYSLGRKFFAYIDTRVAHLGGYKKFMRDFFQANVHKVITVEYFRDELMRWSGIDFTEDFDRYVLGKYGTGNSQGMNTPDVDDHSQESLAESLENDRHGKSAGIDLI